MIFKGSLLTLWLSLLMVGMDVSISARVIQESTPSSNGSSGGSAIRGANVSTSGTAIPSVDLSVYVNDTPIASIDLDEIGNFELSILDLSNDESFFFGPSSTVRGDNETIYFPTPHYLVQQANPETPVQAGPFYVDPVLSFTDEIRIYSTPNATIDLHEWTKPNGKDDTLDSEVLDAKGTADMNFPVEDGIYWIECTTKGKGCGESILFEVKDGLASPVGDFSGDKKIGFVDFAMMRRAFKEGRVEKYDLDKNGALDFHDFSIFSRQWSS